MYNKIYKIYTCIYIKHLIHLSTCTHTCYTHTYITTLIPLTKYVNTSGPARQLICGS